MSVDRGEYVMRYTPQGADTPPGPGTPQDQVHPPGADAPQDQVQPPKTQVHPPGPETTPRPGTPPKTRYTPPGADTPSTENAGRYGQQADDTHPTGMQSCIRNDFKRPVVTTREESQK